MTLAPFTLVWGKFVLQVNEPYIWAWLIVSEAWAIRAGVPVVVDGWKVNADVWWVLGLAVAPAESADLRGKIKWFRRGGGHASTEYGLFV